MATRPERTFPNALLLCLPLTRKSHQDQLPRKLKENKLFFWNGPKETGVIQDFSRYMKCGVTYPSADQVNPAMLATAVFTWAEGEPSQPLADTSCVVLRGETERWHLCDCQENHLFACQSNKNASIWATSAVRGHYAKPVCPDGYYFSIPHNGLQHQQLVNVITGRDVWINLTPYIPLLI